MSKQMSILQFCYKTERERCSFDDGSYTEELNMVVEEDHSNIWKNECQVLSEKFSLSLNTDEPISLEDDTTHVFLFNSDIGLLDTTLFTNNQMIVLPHQLKRWPDVVTALNTLYKDILDKQDRLYFKFKKTLQSYNDTDLGNFTNLDSVFTMASHMNAFTGSVLPRIISLALQVELLFPQGLPALISGGKIKSMTLSQQQIACLLCNIFLCTDNNTYSKVSFNRLFSLKKQTSVEKLKALINYFAKITLICNKVYKLHQSINDQEVLPRCVTFARVSVDKLPDVEEVYTNKICQISDNKKIEDFLGCIQIDFANKNIGGGVLKGGAVQEEIMFIAHPEIICARLFLPTLKNNESFHVIGSECFNRISGYGMTIKWEGNFVDKSERDKYGRIKSNISAIDALPMKYKQDNFGKDNIDRELLKAYSGFRSYSFQNNVFNAVVSGFWGCGAFNGDKELKALIQIIASMFAKRQLIFTTFNNSEFAEKFAELLQLIEKKQLTNKQIYDIITQMPQDTESAFEFLRVYL